MLWHVPYVAYVAYLLGFNHCILYGRSHSIRVFIRMRALYACVYGGQRTDDSKTDNEQNKFCRFVFSALTALLLQNGHCARRRSWQKAIIKCIPNYPSGKLSNFIRTQTHTQTQFELSTRYSHSG